MHECIKTGVSVCVKAIQAEIGTETDRQTEFGLVSLFNGISTFVGYLMSKLSF